MLCGLDGSGKTTLLYSYLMPLKDEFSTEPTLGYNFETLTFDNKSIKVFDIGGDEAVRYIWPTLYRNINF